MSTNTHQNKIKSQIKTGAVVVHLLIQYEELNKICNMCHLRL